MKRPSEGEIRVIAGFAVFLAMLVFSARNGVFLRDSEYMQLVTIMLAGFVAGGRR